MHHLNCIHSYRVLALWPNAEVEQPRLLRVGYRRRIFLVCILVVVMNPRRGIMESIDELLKQYELTRGNLCPGALLAVRMAVLGCAVVGIEDQRGDDHGSLIVWLEIDRWL